MISGIGLPDKKKIKLFAWLLGFILFFVFVSSLINAKKQQTSDIVSEQIDKEAKRLETEKVDEKEINALIEKQLKEAKDQEKKRLQEQNDLEQKQLTETEMLNKKIEEEVSKRIAERYGKQPISASAEKIQPPSMSGSSPVGNVVSRNNKELTPEEQEEMRLKSMMESPIFSKSGSGSTIDNMMSGGVKPSSDIERKVEDLERKLDVKTTQYDNLIMSIGASGGLPTGAGGVPAVPQDSHDAWAKSQPVDAGKVVPSIVHQTANPKTLFEGSIIPVTLLGKINTDLPGTTTAVVNQDIYDSITGEHKVIPKGSKLNIKYNSAVGAGQVRVGMLATRLILTDGRYVKLPNANAADNMGSAGLRDEVDTHFWSLLGTGLLVSMLSVGVENELKGGPGGSQLVTDMYGNQGNRYASAAGQILVETAKMAMKPYNMMKPTLIINEGFSFNVVVNNDISF